MAKMRGRAGEGEDWRVMRYVYFVIVGMYHNIKQLSCQARNITKYNQ